MPVTSAGRAADTSDTRPPPPAEPARGPSRPSSGTLALVVICLVQLMMVLDVSIVDIGLPSLQRDLSLSADALPWVVAAYSLSFGGLLLLGGRAGDLIGRRRALMIGTALFIAASILAGVAGTGALVLAGRSLQGVGAALASPAALALIASTFPEPARRARAMAVYAAMSGVGAATGLIGGGLLTEWASWRLVFLINLPLGVLVLALAPRVLGETPRRGGGIAVTSALSVTAASASLVFALLRADTDGWADALTREALVGFLVFTVLFVVAERRAARPLLPVPVIADTNRAAAHVLALVLGATLLGLLFFTSQFRQTIQHTGPVLTGLGFVPFSACMVVTSQVIARGPAPLRSWTSVAGGLVLVALGALRLSQLDVDASYATGVLAPLVVCGIGVGMTFVPLTLAVTAGVAPQDAGIAGGVLNTAQVLGGALGVAVLTAVARSGLAPTPSAAAITRGYSHAFVALAAILLAAATIALAAGRTARRARRSG